MELYDDPLPIVNCLSSFYSDGRAILFNFILKSYTEENLIDLLELLIVVGGMDPEFRTNDGWSSLMILCRFYTKGNLPDILRLLVRHGADLNATARDGTSAVYLLAHNWSGQLHGVLEQFPPGCIRLWPTEELLLKAAELGCVWTVRSILQQTTMTYNVVDVTGTDAFDRLDNSLSLCIRCKQIQAEKSDPNWSVCRFRPFRPTIQTPLRMTQCWSISGQFMAGPEAVPSWSYARFRAACRARMKRRLLPPPPQRMVFENELVTRDGDIFRVDPMVSEISPPSSGEWEKLLRDWHGSGSDPSLQGIFRYMLKHSHRPSSACHNGRCKWCRVRKNVDVRHPPDYFLKIGN